MKRKNLALSNFFLLVVYCLWLAGCSGNGGGTGPEVATGKFIDAPVAGLNYVSGGQKGTTGADGSFKYEVGKTVTFSVGGIVLGTTQGLAIVTPINLAPDGSSASTTQVTNIAQFLQTVGQTDNGVLTIPQSVTTAAATQTLNFATVTQSDLQTVTSAIAPGSTLVSPTTAQTTLTENIYSLFQGSYSGTYAAATIGTQITSLPKNGTLAVSIDANGNVSGTAIKTNPVPSVGYVPDTITGTMSTTLSSGTKYVFTGTDSKHENTWTGILDIVTHTFTGTYGTTDTGTGTFTCSSFSATTPTAPTAPTGVTATPGTGQVTVAWTSAGGASYYNIYWSTTSGVTAANGSKTAFATNPYTLTGLTNGITYYFIVTAVDAFGQESSASAQVSATPAVAPPPAAPTGVTAVGGTSQVGISWTAVSGATSYNIYYSTSSTVTQATGTEISGITGTSYTLSGLTNGTTYYFIVTAVNANGESSPSAVVSATPTASTAPYIQAIVLSLAGGANPLGWLQMANVYTDATQSTPIATATVTVNGTTLSYDSAKQRYLGTLAIAQGAAVNLSVTINGTTYTASGTQYSTYPTVTSGTTLQAANANTMTWTAGAPTASASYVIGLLGSNGKFAYPSSESGEPAAVSASSTSYAIPANSLAAGSYYLLVGIGNQSTGTLWGGGDGNGITIPDTATGSGLWIGGISSFVTVTVQ